MQYFTLIPSPITNLKICVPIRSYLKKKLANKPFIGNNSFFILCFNVCLQFTFFCTHFAELVNRSFVPGSLTAQFLSMDPELGTLLFEIAQSLFALEQTMILGAMELNKNKSNERTDKSKI